MIGPDPSCEALSHYTFRYSDFGFGASVQKVRISAISQWV